MRKNSVEDTIVACATPIGEGGIGIVRMSGPKALKIADSVFTSKDAKKPSDYGMYSVHYGHIVDEGSRVKGQGSRAAITTLHPSPFTLHQSSGFVVRDWDGGAASGVPPESDRAARG